MIGNLYYDLDLDASATTSATLEDESSLVLELLPRSREEWIRGGLNAGLGYLLDHILNITCRVAAACKPVNL